jgi:hypothetical protein
MSVRRSVFIVKVKQLIRNVVMKRSVILVMNGRSGRNEMIRHLGIGVYNL